MTLSGREIQGQFTRMEIFVSASASMLVQRSPDTRSPGISSGDCGHVNLDTEKDPHFYTQDCTRRTFLTLSTIGLNKDSPVPALTLFLKLPRTQRPLRLQLHLPSTYLQL